VDCIIRLKPVEVPQRATGKRSAHFMFPRLFLVHQRWVRPCAGGTAAGSAC